MKTTFDIVVIGSGPGGYSAAIRASQLGYSVALIEKYSTLGGTCTNVGCIPSKALLDTTEHYHAAQTKFSKHGIELNDLRLNFEQLMYRKSEVVKQNTSGLMYLMKKNKVEVFEGTASFISNRQITVSTKTSEEILLEGTYYIIATGSKPSAINGVTFDKHRIISSTEALSLREKPQSMIIIGGGVIGVEMASIFSRVGVQVTIIEYAGNLIPTMDLDLAKELQKIFTKKNIKVILNSRVQSVQNQGDRVKLNYLDVAGQEYDLEADYCLVAAGRKPYTDSLGIENTDVIVDEKGRVLTNDLLQTNVPNIYAIGDVVKGPMLAHKAEEEGVFVAEIIKGQKPHINYKLIPGVVYTWPEIASVGHTEEELKRGNVSYRVGKFPFSASGRARAAMESEGFVKVLSDTKYGEVLGVHILGPRAADLIGTAVTGMHYETTDEDMFRISYAHPTYSEALKEAFLQASGQGSLNI
jgi:dihydrolipoamide dehydrogenase